MSSSSDSLKEHLINLGVLLIADNYIQNIQSLRKVVVQEMLDNVERYSYALLSSDKDYKGEVEKFRKCGYFSSK